MSMVSITKALAAEASTCVRDDDTKTLPQKLKYMVTHITVEPLMLMGIIPSIMNGLATQNMNLEKSCRVNLQYNTSVCDAMVKRDLTGYESFQEAEVQKLVSQMVAIKMAVLGSWPVLFMLFLGSWSDRNARRKPLILVPLVGDLIGTTFLLVCAHYLTELSVEYSMLAETIPIALGGTWACAFLGIYTYVSGLCNDKERTLRIGAVTMCHYVSLSIGNFLSGFMIDILGFKGVYTLSIISMSLALIYGYFLINDDQKWNIKTKERKKSFLNDFFSLKHIKSTFETCFKKGLGNRRLKVSIIMFLSLLIMGPVHGESAVQYLFTRRKFGWNEIDFSVYNSLVSVVQIVGGTFALAFFSKYLKLHDSILGIISISTRMCATFVFAFAPSGLVYYVGGFIEIFQSTCHISMRALMSKIVPPHELGQSNSVFGLFEAVTPLAFGPLYSTLYSYTISSFPGMFFLLSAGFHLITLFLFHWLYKCREIQEEEFKKEHLKDGESQLLKTEQCDRKR